MSPDSSSIHRLTIDETLELIAESSTRFRSARLEPPLHGDALFGGFVCAQSIEAARRTVDAAFYVQSVQGAYVSPTIRDRPIQYDIEKLRDGKSFCLRVVRATQADRLIWTALCSFQRRGDGGKEPRWQVEMPRGIQIQPEDGLRPEDKYEKLLQRTDLSDFMRAHAMGHRDMHLRSPHDAVNARHNDDDLRSGIPDGDCLMWMKLRSRVSDPGMQLSALAYISDHDLAFAVAKAVNLTPFSSPRSWGIGTSLNHSIQFYDNDIDLFEQWHLYQFSCTVVGNARGIVRANMFTRDGKLIATVTQEFLQRSAPGPWAYKL